jgi:uncharacterized protein YqkB
MVKLAQERADRARDALRRAFTVQATHDGSVAYDTAGDARLASGLIINDDRDLKAVRSL